MLVDNEMRLPYMWLEIDHCHFKIVTWIQGEHPMKSTHSKESWDSSLVRVSNRPRGIHVAGNRSLSFYSKRVIWIQGAGDQATEHPMKSTWCK
jgi:hypothetical protein